jgi:hypothetical protein
LETENSKDITFAEAELLRDGSVIGVHGTSCVELESGAI